MQLFDDVLSFNNLSEDHVLSVEPGAGDEGDEELGTVGVRAGIGHGEQVGLGVLQLEVFISEFLSVDGFSSSAVLLGEVSSLGHEIVDDSVEWGSLVSESLFSSAQSLEVSGGLRDNLVEELENNLSSCVAADFDFKENFGHEMYGLKYYQINS